MSTTLGIQSVETVNRNAKVHKHQTARKYTTREYPDPSALLKPTRVKQRQQEQEQEETCYIVRFTNSSKAQVRLTEKSMLIRSKFVEVAQLRLW